MFSSLLDIIAILVITAQAWGLKWYGGINLDCNIIPAGSTDFYIRTYKGHHLPSPCVPVNGSARGVRCHSDVYDYGVLASTEGCDRELGWGSAEAFGAGCCRFYNNAQCGGTPFLQISEGGCVSDVVITAFICSDNC
ncbi:hypothetical protein VP1G_09744 [Cytospora mali]|uniref:Uncharacterized protein n=1 Tax=Cytospora mali TaxID=578113 RepID=A0A194VFF5_CYTMA|nr:hypothetical protein VP1G_09744 [Valsa mali var. pyri (nom. inval.)]